MKKIYKRIVRTSGFSIVTAFAIAFMMALPIVAEPADKATGSVGWYESWDPPTVPGEGQYRYTSFNAHDGSGDRPMKGYMIMETYAAADDAWRRTFEWAGDTWYVNVAGDYAWFAGMCTYDSSNAVVGRWLVVMIYNAGSSGSTGDTMKWSWHTESVAMDMVADMATPGGVLHLVESGNLVVHDRMQVI